MQSGRKPKPTAVKALEGNPGKRSLNTGEPKPEKKAPRCPAWLEGEAKKEWKRMAGQMEKLGILTEIDMAAFAGYCQAYARWKEAEEFITQHGTIVKTPSGYWQLESHLPMVRIAVLYAAAYLYEHREQADHGELVQTLRSLLFGIRKEVF